MVVFDLDDTLIVEQSFAMASLREALSVFPDVDPEQSETIALEAIRRVWRQGPDHPVCTELGIASWEGLWATFEGNHSTLSGVRDWAHTYRNDAWIAVAESLGVGQTRLAAVASERFQLAQHRGHPVIDGARSVVTLLAKRHRLGLLTNGSSDLQRDKLDGTGMTAAFDSIVISGEVGSGKPNSATFADMLERLGVRPEDSVMVGDSWERDILGAVNAGMSAVWIASGRPAPGHHQRVATVDNIENLIEILDGSSAQAMP